MVSAYLRTAELLYCVHTRDARSLAVLALRAVPARVDRQMMVGSLLIHVDGKKGGGTRWYTTSEGKGGGTPLKL